MRGDEDAKDHKEAVLNTKDVFFREFGEQLGESTGFADCNGESVCTGDDNKILAFADCNGESVCSGDQNKIENASFSSRPVFH